MYFFYKILILKKKLIYHLNEGKLKIIRNITRFNVQPRIYISQNFTSSIINKTILLNVKLFVKNRTILLEHLNKIPRKFCLSYYAYILIKFLKAISHEKLLSLFLISSTDFLRMLILLEGKNFFYWFKKFKYKLTWINCQLPAINNYISLLDWVIGDQNKNFFFKKNFNPLKNNKYFISGDLRKIEVSLPSRNNIFFLELKSILKLNNFSKDLYTKKWILYGTTDILNFFSENLIKLKHKFLMQFSQNLLTIFNTLKFISYSIKLNYYTINYFLLRIDILYGKSYKNKLIENLKKSMYFVQVKEYRTTFLLNKYLLFFIKKLQYYFSTSTYNIKFQFNFTSKKSLADILDVVDIFIAYKFKFYIDPRLNKIFCIIKNFKNQKLPPIKKSLILYLKPYQIYGIKWLWTLSRFNLSGILADDMGLGKTIQVIILIYLHIKYSLLQKKKTLVLCPSSLINNWIEEFKILKYISESNHFTIITTNVNYKSVLSTQCIICSFTIFQNNFFLLYFMPYRLLILDEAQFIKNIRTNLHRSLLKIKVTSKFLLTGTPIENKMKDLFTLYNFIIPGFLNNFFNNTLSWIDIRWLELRLLKKKDFFMLRRLKCNVMKYLPLKREFIIKFKSINFQRYFYNKTTLNFSVLNKNCSSSTVLNKIMILRKACLDPILFFFNYKQKNITKTLKFLFILFIMRLSIFLKKKVIIFSQFASFLNIISSYLDKTFLTYLLLSGFTKNKTKVCMEFNYGTMVNILLMSSKSGSLGFNINEADIVVHYDPWWNPAFEEQASDRAYRLDKKKNLLVLKLLILNSIEEYIYNIQLHKKNIYNFFQKNLTLI